MKRTNYKFGEFLLGIPTGSSVEYYNEHPQPIEDFVFIHDGYINGDGYGQLIGINNGKVVKSSGYGNFMWGGNVRPATDEEIEKFMKKVMNQNAIYEY